MAPLDVGRKIPFMSTLEPTAFTRDEHLDRPLTNLVFANAELSTGVDAAFRMQDANLDRLRELCEKMRAKPVCKPWWCFWQ